MQPLLLFLFGLGLVIVGISISGGDRTTSNSAENRAFSVCGSISQRISNVRLIVGRKRQATSRDWLSLVITLIGLGVSVVGLIRTG